MKNKKYKKFLIIALIVIVLIAVIFFVTKKEKEAPEIKINLEEITNNIDNANKNIAIEVKEDKIINHFGEASKNWQLFYENFKENQPEEYKKSRDWSKKLWEIKVLSAKAYELSLEGDIEAAKFKSAKARDIYLQIKKENNILDMSDELLQFYKQSILLNQAENKAEIIILLPKIKISFVNIKERKNNKEFIVLINKIEKTITDLDRQLDGPDLQQAQKDILILAKELYLNY